MLGMDRFCRRGAVPGSLFSDHHPPVGTHRQLVATSAYI